MNSRDLLSLCWGNLMRRKTRTILAIVGVVVGICAIVVMVSIGFGLSESFKVMLSSWGNLHTIEVYNYGGGGQSSTGQTYSLDENTISKIGKINGVTAASPVRSEYLLMGIGHMVASAEIYGIKPEIMEHMDLDVAEGRLLNSADKYQLVFGKNVASWFYNPRQQQSYAWDNTEPTVDVITKDLIISNDWNLGTNNEGEGLEGNQHYSYIEAEGVGLLANENDESTYRVYMNIDALEEMKAAMDKELGNQVQTNGKKTYNNAIVYVDDTERVAAVCEEIKTTYGFQTYSLTDTLESMNETAKMIELILGGIGAISLLVAAIGIANTMIMSVYERTKEIGIMKVIGASLSDIGKMFLIEAGMIGFIGGIIGLAISYGLSILLNTVLLPVVGSLLGYAGEGMVASVIPWWLSILALLFTTLVGVLSGYYPARRAMGLSALEGLRND